MPANADLLTSFDFPDKLTVEAFDAYQSVLIPAFDKYKSPDGTVSPIRYQAIVFRAATKAGLLRNWKSKLMPKLEPSDVAEGHVGVIEWAGKEIDTWLGAQRAVPKASFWRWVLLLIETVRLRRNSSKPGDATG